MGSVAILMHIKQPHGIIGHSFLKGISTICLVINAILPVSRFKRVGDYDVFQTSAQ